MNCQDVLEQLEIYALGESDAETARTIQSHLAGCPSCPSALAETKSLVDRLDQVLGQPAAPADLSQRIITQVGRRSHRRHLGHAILAAAACLVVVLCLRYLLWPGAGGPGEVELVGCTMKAEPQASFEVLGQRRLRLDSGEVYFDVEPGGDRFVVETPAGEVRVLGTRFHVASGQSTGRSKGGHTMSKARHFTTVIVVAGIVQLANIHGAVTGYQGDVLHAQEDSAPKKQAEALAARFGSHYEAVAVDVKPAVPPYPLPVKPAEVSSLDEVLKKMGVKETKFLAQHGFAVYPTSVDDFAKYYKRIKDLEVPVYVTADSVLHLYHMQFDEILKITEQKEFIPALAALLTTLDEYIVKQPQVRRRMLPQLDEARRLARTYLHLTRRLLTDRSAERPLLEELRKSVEKADDRSWGIADKHEEAMKSFADSLAARQAINGVPRKGKGAALKIIDAELAAIDAARPKAGLLTKADEDAIAQELEFIAAHKGFEESPLFRYQEDYSQYVPRGHYTKTPALKRYFKAMMYMGRLTFLVKGGDPYGPGAKYLVSAAEAKRQTLTAAVLTEALEKAALDDGLRAAEVWARIYDVTAFMVGLADDLGYEEYSSILKNPAVFNLNAVPKGMLTAGFLLSDENFFVFKKQVAAMQPPAIYSGTGNVVTADPEGLAGIANPEELDKVLARTMGFRLMGQRFVPDSYWMGRLVTPAVRKPLGDKRPFTLGMTALGPRRVFPRGLDVAALLGSKRAADIMAETGDAAYDGYDKAFAGLQEQLAGLSETDWNINLYWSWLYCLKPLLGEFGEGYPTCMRQPEWQDKELATALGSWSQLRHDTILYVKQSYAPKEGEVSRIPAKRPGYVEPVAEFYGRLLALCRLTKDRMAAMKCLDDQMTRRLAETEKLLARLLDISKRELENKVLAEDDYEFIRTFAGALQRASVGFQEQDTKTTLVADVHTDANTRKVLEEATGELGLLVVVSKLPDGKLYAACGPVFTYYEFKQPMADRLTDGAWRKMLSEGNGRRDLLPDWVRKGFAAGWSE